MLNGRDNMLKCIGISYATVLRLDLVAAGERGLQVVADLPTCCGNFFREGEVHSRTANTPA